MWVWLGRVSGIALIVFTVASWSPPPQSDWQRFDHQSFEVVSATGGDLFAIATPLGSQVVRLLGVQAPPTLDPSTNTPAHGGEASANYLQGRLDRRTVTLRLDNLQTRDADQALRAYVYLTDTDCLNLDAIHDGMAYADRRSLHAYHLQFEQAENEARRKQRGFWKGLTEDMMPAWRRAWLHSLVKDRQ